jgi:cell wall-associated NlpC family hydrolase
VLDEQANQARLEAERLAGEMAKVQEALTEARADLAAARRRLRNLAVEAYVSGGRLPGAQALLYDDGSTLAIRTGYLAHSASRQRQAIDDLHAAEEELGEQEAALARTRAAADAAAAQAAAARGEAERVLVGYRATLNQVKGELAELVAAEERRRAEEEARRVRARLEAERRAAAEAARRRAPSGGTLLSAPTGPAPAPAPGAATAVEEAKRQLGKPYEWGGTGPDSFDCSGLTAWAWRAGGVRLSHSSQAQYKETARVALTQIQPGDLVFYGNPIHHVGIYVGGGRMVNAPRTGYTVRYDSIYRDDLVGVGRPR